MERVRPLIRLLSVAAVAATGCAAAERTMATSYHQMKEVVGTTPSAPASQVLCFWQRKVVSLPDPTRDGQSVPGLVGQLFLITPDNQPADVTGSLTVSMTDMTPRPAGQPQRTTEVFHYTPQVLKQLATHDERFGKSHALYLMWPADWRDVTAVAVNVRYDSPGQTSLYATETQLAIEAGGAGAPVRLDGTNVIGRRAADPAWATTTRGVPDPNRLMAAMQSSPAVAPPQHQQPAAVLPPPSLPQSQTPAAPPLAGFGPNATTVFGGPPNPAVAFPKPVIVTPGSVPPTQPPRAIFEPAPPQPPVVLPPPTMPSGQPVVPQEPVTTVIRRGG